MLVHKAEVGKTPAVLFFNLESQNIAMKLLEKNNIKNPITVLRDINKIIFYTSIEYFRWYVEGNKKNSDLINRFYLLFDNHKEMITKYLEEKYK